jgi:hypothetical protein
MFNFHMLNHVAAAEAPAPHSGNTIINLMAQEG